jgi:hypothetical protein
VHCFSGSNIHGKIRFGPHLTLVPASRPAFLALAGRFLCLTGSLMAVRVSLVPVLPLQAALTWFKKRVPSANCMAASSSLHQSSISHIWEVWNPDHLATLQQALAGCSASHLQPF